MDEYAKRYGKGSIVLRTPVELVGLRAIGIGQHHPGQRRRRRPGRRSRPEPWPPRSGPAGPPGRGADGIVEVDVYDGASLSPGHELKGAGLVDSMDTTVWVPEGSSARIDQHGTFIMEVAR